MPRDTTHLLPTDLSSATITCGCDARMAALKLNVRAARVVNPARQAVATAQNFCKDTSTTRPREPRDSRDRSQLLHFF